MAAHRMEAISCAGVLGEMAQLMTQVGMGYDEELATQVTAG